MASEGSWVLKIIQVEYTSVYTETSTTNYAKKQDYITLDLFEIHLNHRYS